MSSDEDSETDRLLNLHLRNRHCRALVPVKKKTVVVHELPDANSRLGKVQESLRKSLLESLGREKQPISIVDKLRQANLLCAQLQRSAAHVDDVLRTLSERVQTPEKKEQPKPEPAPDPDPSPSPWTMVGNFKSYDTFESDSDDGSVDLSTSLAEAMEEIGHQDDNADSPLVDHQDERDDTTPVVEDAPGIIAGEDEFDEDEVSTSSSETDESRVGIARADYGSSPSGAFPVSPAGAFPVPPVNMMINNSPNQWASFGDQRSRRRKPVVKSPRVKSPPELKSMSFGLASISERLFDPSAEGEEDDM
mmetsp:Transcript_42274/g.62681  ORF Transcript_42274/g.62681 Transcript_42274/m.62681 type:complete len:306 (-) Transcript_42274:217-1134(-)|eukprot:CAMPEP_0194049008 /NCGR_PEP_ID=MMETSP0009_2-20130614/29348_1 /TAXON_ID=210454 /ORGANISM="Grammatophora oceanica, Strain CCMP 410" /LENGTH=305 /DNA_ID=CAMNT_0038695059 /DNA_START=151 /DNA_END=1068 /DNA_ORIENTATION=+